MLDSPFFETGYKLYIIGLKPIRAVEKPEKVITIWVIVDRRRYRKRGCVVQLVLLIIVLWILTTCLPLFMFLAAGESININLHKCDEILIIYQNIQTKIRPLSRPYRPSCSTCMCVNYTHLRLDVERHYMGSF